MGFVIFLLLVLIVLAVVTINVVGNLCKAVNRVEDRLATQGSALLLINDILWKLPALFDSQRELLLDIQDDAVEGHEDLADGIQIVIDNQHTADANHKGAFALVMEGLTALIREAKVSRQRLADIDFDLSYMPGDVANKVVDILTSKRPVPTPTKSKK